MSRQQLGEHHQHIRRRIHQKFEEYPHPHKWKNIVDKLVIIGGVVGPIMTLPQVLEIYVHQNAAGVSIPTWSTYIVLSLLWLTYGILHKEMPIIITNILFFILDVIIVAGAVVYG